MEPELTESQRREKNSLAFLDHVAGMAGYTLRPPSYWTLEVIGPALLDLSLARGKAAYKALAPYRMSDEVNVYLFVQSAPVPVVSRAVRSFRRALEAGVARDEAWEDFISDHIDPFLADLSPETKGELKEQLSALDEIGAANVKAVAPKDHKPERSDPKSGSQAGSPLA